MCEGVEKHESEGGGELCFERLKLFLKQRDMQRIRTTKDNQNGVRERESTQAILYWFPSQI
jgi:hypothetical protein